MSRIIFKKLTVKQMGKTTAGLDKDLFSSSTPTQDDHDCEIIFTTGTNTSHCTNSDSGCTQQSQDTSTASK